MIKNLVLVYVLLLSSLGVAAAKDFSVGDIEISRPWSRPTPPNAMVAGGYVTLVNNGRETDTLIAVETDISTDVEIHQSSVQNGVASMRPVEGVVLEPGAIVDFEAERLHFMFIEPQQQLKEAETFAATLVFEKAGRVDVEFAVQRRASEPSTDDHSRHGSAH